MRPKHLVDEAIKHFGTINILVNNAGITNDGLILMSFEVSSMLI